MDSTRNLYPTGSDKDYRYLIPTTHYPLFFTLYIRSGHDENAQAKFWPIVRCSQKKSSIPQYNFQTQRSIFKHAFDIDWGIWPWKFFSKFFVYLHDRYDLVVDQSFFTLCK